MTTVSSSLTARRRPPGDLRRPRLSGHQTPDPENLQRSELRSRRREVTANARASSTPSQGSCRWAHWSLTPRSWTTRAPAPPALWAPGRWYWRDNWGNVTLWTLHTAPGSHYLCLLTVHVIAGHPASHQELLPAREGAIPATGITQDPLSIKIRGSSQLSTEIHKNQKSTRFFALEVSRYPNRRSTSQVPFPQARTPPFTASRPLRAAARTSPRWSHVHTDH